MTDITELAQNLKAAAEKAKHAGGSDNVFRCSNLRA